MTKSQAIVTQPATAPNENMALIAMLERVAVNPDVDPAKLEKLLDLQERVLNKQAESDYAQAMSAAQSEMKRVGTDAANPQTRSKYASYAALDKALRPIYTKHGFALSFNSGPSPSPEHVRVMCDVSHRGGCTKHFEIDMPADGKGAKGGDVMTKTHAMGAAMSYGMRYLLKMIFNVAVGEDDDDGNGASGYDCTDWFTVIDEAASLDELNQLAIKIKAAKIPADAVKAIRARWAQRAKAFKQ